MITQATIIITVLLGFLSIILPRKLFLLPYVIAACFIPADQRIIIMGVDFTVLRILVVCGVFRLFVRNELRFVKKSGYDVLLLSWTILGVFVFVVQWGNTQALINRSGVLFDILGLYWIFRQTIGSWKEIYRVMKMFAVCGIILTGFVAFERMTKTNPFDYLGDVVTGFHRGRYRCRGPYPHSIILGLFWITLCPLFYAFLKYDKKKMLWVGAIAASLAMMIMSASSTPIMTFFAVIVFWFLYKYRIYGKHILMSICGMAVILHFIRGKPVWHLISRIDIFGGSTGWHRYHLINEAINRFGEWCLLGTQSTEHWGYGLGDVTNQYVLEGVRGGFATVVLFVALLVWSVRISGKYSMQRIPLAVKLAAWSICVMTLGHCVSFIAVSYFGQIKMLLYMNFAIIGFMYNDMERINVYEKQMRLANIENNY